MASKLASKYEIPISLQDFVIDSIQFGKQIGRGANGRILEAKWERITVAVKEIHSIFINEVSEPEFQAFKRSFLRECEQSSRLRHPNIVRFFGIYYPPGARVPSLVMERLHCSLTNLLEQNSLLPIETKLSIIHDVALGLRYLHTRTPIIIHRDLSSNNILISKGMEGKIGDLGTARLVDPTRQSQMTKAPGTVDFMPPEALAASGSVKYERELDVFSFGCVMLHTLSHQWPTPTEPVVTDPITFEMKAKSEAERRSDFFDKIDKNTLGVLIPTIKSCLNNIPRNRASIVQVCSQLEGLVNKQHSFTDETDLPLSALQLELAKKDAEIHRKDAEIHRKDAEIQKRDTQIQNNNIQIQRQASEIEALKSGMTKLQMKLKTHEPVSPKADMLSRQFLQSTFYSQEPDSFEVSKSSSDFWSNLQLTWEQCADLPADCWACSVAELDGKIYTTGKSSRGDYIDPLVYNSYEDKWFVLPELPYSTYSLVAVPYKKQLLAIGGTITKGGISKTTNKVFAWDENSQKWITPYPNMPTARCYSSVTSFGLAVIVAGGVTNWDPQTLTGAVEVLHIKEHSGLFSKSQWSVVEPLPHVVYDAVPLITDDKLYIAVGFDDDGESNCNIVSACLPELLQSNVKKARSGRVWNKLPDMPYSSWSINHYQGRLVIFTGDHKVEQPEQGKAAWELLSLIHLYNPDTKSWDHVGDFPHNYLVGKSVQIRENKLLFIGGLTGTHMIGKADDSVTTCLMLTLAPQQL